MAVVIFAHFFGRGEWSWGQARPAHAEEQVIVTVASSYIYIYIIPGNRLEGQGMSGHVFDDCGKLL